jgi:hypothetical protein
MPEKEQATRFGNFDARTAKLLTGSFFIAMLLVAFLLYLDLRSGLGIPSAAHPSCSWMSAPPRDASSTCNSIYQTLQAIAQAEYRGDAATIRKLVTNSTTATTIISDGRKEHARGVQSIHVAPSLTLGPMPDGTDEAVIALVFRTHGGGRTSPQQIYIRLSGERVRLVNDRPDEEW